jgi:hypothetical protein
MSFVNGLLGLGVGIVSGVITEPASAAGYFRAPISFDVITGGVTLNVVNGTFGPVVGSGSPWGTLSVFQVFDQFGNPGWTGTLQAPVTPVQGELIYVPVGVIALAINSQLNASGAASGLQPAIFMPSGTILGNPTSGVSGPLSLTISSGLDYASGAISGTGSVFVTPATSGAIGGLIVPSGSYFTADVSGNLGFGPIASGTVFANAGSGAAAPTPVAMTALLTAYFGAYFSTLGTTLPSGSGEPWNNGGVLCLS